MRDLRRNRHSIDGDWAAVCATTQCNQRTGCAVRLVRRACNCYRMWRCSVDASQWRSNMRPWRFALVFVAGALVFGPAFAQPQPVQPPGGGFGGFGFGGGGFGGIGMSAMLASNKQLQDELKMDEEQLGKLRD